MRSFLVSLLLVPLVLQPVQAQDSKTDHLATLEQAGQALTQDKAAGLTPVERDQLMADYTAASAALGGDDPYGLLAQDDGGITPLAAPPAPPGGTATTTNFANNTPVAIPDGPGGMVSSDVMVSGIDTYLWDVDLTVDITHTFAADLEVTLTSPGGTVVVVTTDNGGGNDDVFSGSLFDDQAGTPVTLFTYTDGVTATPLVPEGALGAFIGEDPNGTWTLDITDDAGLDTGMLNSWSLDVTTLSGAPTLTGPVNTAIATGTAIPDGPGGMLSEDLVVSGLDTFACDVNLNLDITHTFAADLEVLLTSPGGTQTALTLDNGGGNDDVFSGSTFDDDAPVPVTDFVYTDGVTATPLAPQGALAAFIGEDPNGTWTLAITDDAGLDTGTLNGWSLDIVTCTGSGVPETTPVPTLSNAALAVMLVLFAGLGLLVLRRTG